MIADQDKPYQIQELNPLHREILRRLVLGERQVDIARNLGITVVCVNYVKNSSLGQDKLASLEHFADMEAVDVNRRLREIAPVCVETLIDLMLDQEVQPTVRSSNAKDILDRAGFGAVQRSINTNLNRTLSNEELQALRDGAREAGIVDIEISMRENSEPENSELNDLAPALAVIGADLSLPVDPPRLEYES